ncbi:MAG: hypothetical protein WCO19_01900 [Candidatus Saccharibacteria bacterium]
MRAGLFTTSQGQAPHGRSLLGLTKGGVAASGRPRAGIIGPAPLDLAGVGGEGHVQLGPFDLHAGASVGIREVGAVPVGDAPPQQLDPNAAMLSTAKAASMAGARRKARGRPDPVSDNAVMNGPYKRWIDDTGSVWDLAGNPLPSQDPRPPHIMPGSFKLKGTIDKGWTRWIGPNGERQQDPAAKPGERPAGAIKRDAQGNWYDKDGQPVGFEGVQTIASNGTGLAVQSGLQIAHDRDLAFAGGNPFAVKAPAAEDARASFLSSHMLLIVGAAVVVALVIRR